MNVNNFNFDNPPPPPQLQRAHRIGIGNTPQEIEKVNNNRGIRIILYVNGGGPYTTWYYYQDDAGKFFKIASTLSRVEGEPPTIEYQELDGPLDPTQLSSY
jgi:hypothetical protein